MPIVMQFPKEFVDEAKKTIKDGEQYAQKMFQVLVTQYGDDPKLIDIEGLNEQGTGQIINAIVGGHAPMPPTDLLAERLFWYSDIGLEKHGLTRKKYNKAKANGKGTK